VETIVQNGPADAIRLTAHARTVWFATFQWRNGVEGATNSSERGLTPM